MNDSKKINTQQTEFSVKAFRKSAIVETVKHFDELPNSALVRNVHLEILLGLSRSTIWRWVRDGLLPEPLKRNGRAVGFRVGDVRAALAKGTVPDIAKEDV